MAEQTVYEFCLILDGIADLTPDVIDPLYEAGCDDALVGMRGGEAYIDFGRPATSFGDAVLGAIADVMRADIGVEVVRVEPLDEAVGYRAGFADVNSVLAYGRVRRRDPQLAADLLAAVSPVYDKVVAG